MRASGSTPMRRAVDSRISTIAAAPSALADELAAVITPSALKAAFSVGTFSGFSLDGRSSRITPVVPEVATGANSQSKRPPSAAARARSIDAMANRSSASRLKPYFAAHCSPNRPIGLPCS
jgi:hypothetical protein